MVQFELNHSKLFGFGSVISIGQKNCLVDLFDFLFSSFSNAKINVVLYFYIIENDFKGERDES